VLRQLVQSVERKREKEDELHVRRLLFKPKSRVLWVLIVWRALGQELKMSRLHST
jgi:hypothetical protein